MKGLPGCKIIAFICSKDLASCLPISISEIMSQKYKVFINNRPKVIADNWEEFCSNYNLIEAAGGLVYNQENELLMIFRNVHDCSSKKNKIVRILPTYFFNPSFTFIFLY